MKILNNVPDDNEKIQTLDDSCANKWKWEWMMVEVDVDVKKIYPEVEYQSEIKIILKDCIRKLELAGKAMCTLCTKSDDDAIKYGSKGVGALKQHVMGKNHIKKVITTSQNYKLPGAAQGMNKSYGAPPTYHDSPATTVIPPQATVHLADRISNMEAMVTSFIAEKSLPFTLAEPIIDLAKELSKDPQAMAKLHLFRTTASYKMVHGTGRTFTNDLIRKLQSIPFSINMDEATAQNNDRVCALLVTYYSHIIGNIVTEHLTSFNLPVCTSEILYKAMLDLFNKMNLPWDRLLSILMDSASVMRGSKSGLEKRIRDTVAPHLLDIDGDICHHVHNIVKKFTKSFDSFLETLFRDIFKDFDLSNDLLSRLKQICYHLGLSFRVPPNFIATRWLSVYDVCMEFCYLRDAYIIFYYSFFDESKSKRKALDGIFNRLKVSDVSQQKIVELRSALKKKKFTTFSKARKQRIQEKLLFSTRKVTLIASFYESVLPIFKQFIMCFQSSKPRIHKVYYKQIGLISQFLSFFIKPKILSTCKTGKKLANLKINDSDILSPRLIFVGQKARKMIEKAKPDDETVNKFLESALDAYKKCGVYALQKLPLQNKTLKTLAVIDPEFILSRSEGVLMYLLKLSNILPVLTNDEEENYGKEVRKLMIDQNLPTWTDDEDEEEKGNKGDISAIVCWWKSISHKYPTAFKIVMGALSIFSAPRVESSFSLMSDIVDKKANRMNVGTLSAVQTIKYALSSAHPEECTSRAIKHFHREDKHYSPVDPSLASNMRLAYSRLKEKQGIERSAMEEKDGKFKPNDNNSRTKKQVKELSAKVANSSCKKHQEILNTAYKPQKKRKADDQLNEKKKRSHGNDPK